MVWRSDASGRVAHSLLTLYDQVDGHYPGRAKGNDGTLGDEKHQATKSDHNRDERGIVRALDITHDPAHGFDSYAFADFLRTHWDDRVQYIISNSRIANGDIENRAWRPYGGGGKDPHDHHIHISARHDDRADDPRPWDIAAFLGGVTAPPPPPPAPFVPLDQRTIDAIASAAAASDLARYTWGGRGRAPLGYVQGVAIVFGQVLRRLAAGDSVARAMVRVVNGPGDVFDHYQSILVAAGMPTRGAPDIDRLRALFVILTGLGIRESSGGDDIGRDVSANNVTADTAEGGTWQQSWDSRGASPELPKLFAACVGTEPDAVDAIFKRGTSPKPSAFQNFGDPDSDGYKFQALVKARPSIAALFAVVAMRTLRGHWGPLNHHEVEVAPAADALFRQVQEIVGTPAVVTPPVQPNPKTPPIRQPDPLEGTAMDDKVKLTLITEIVKPSPDTKALHLLLLDAPVVPAPSGTGGTLPATPPIATPPAPAIPNTIPNNLSLGGAGSLAAIAASLAGLLGMPVGPEMTQTGLWSFAIPLISGLLKANVPAANAVLGMIGGKKS